MNFTADYLSKLTDELLRATARSGPYHSFQNAVTGEEVQGSTETDVIKHLTSSRDFFPGRQTRFPGLSNGADFSAAVTAAGFRIVRARNVRGQLCNVVTL